MIFLRSRVNSVESADQLVANFLHHGDLPMINGAENLSCFDICEYLTQRCGEIFSARKCNSTPLSNVLLVGKLMGIEHFKFKSLI